ncbi:MAG: selenium metabolism-associated LysR family transcriptional regulator [Eubacteriales bacterium]|jgi:DNA-binding transcriptional LysR family regulator
MDLRQLEAFVLIAQGSSFSEAARRLYLTQPTVSAHIASLERELGEKLLERSTRSARLTPAGEKLYRTARRMIALRDQVLEQFGVPQEPQAQEVAVGASTIPSKYMLPQLLADFRRKYPDCSFRVVYGTSAQLLEQVRSREIPLALVGLMDPTRLEGCTAQPVYVDRLVLVTPNTFYYRALWEQQAPLEQLLQEPLILREFSSGARKEAENYLHSMGVEEQRLRVVARINDQETIKRAIAQGVGISIMTGKAVEEECREGRLLSFPLVQGKVERPIYLIHDPRQPMARSERIFFRFVQEYYSAQRVKIPGEGVDSARGVCYTEATNNQTNDAEE